MATVTELAIQKRDPDRVSVFLDGEFAWGVPKIVAARLRVGQEISAETLASLRAEALWEEAKDKALHFLEHRPRSSAEIRRYLQSKGYETAIIERVLDRLRDVQLVDDQAFARYWIDQRATFKPRSAFALRAELAQKGLNRDAIDEALTDVDETAQARRAAEQQLTRWQHLSADDRRTRLAAFLQRRGFRYDLIEAVLTELDASEPEAGPDERSD